MVITLEIVIEMIVLIVGVTLEQRRITFEFLDFFHDLKYIFHQFKVKVLHIIFFFFIRY